MGLSGNGSRNNVGVILAGRRCAENISSQWIFVASVVVCKCNDLTIVSSELGSTGPHFQ